MAVSPKADAHSNDWMVQKVEWSTIPFLVTVGVWLGIELVAALNKNPGDTFSEHVWRWFRVRTDAQTTWSLPAGKHRNGAGWVTYALRTVLGLFLTWAFLHLTFGLPAAPWEWLP